MVTIYHSPMARSCRIIWLAEELGLQYHLETMDLFSEQMTGQSYLEIHPLGKVPAIKDGDLALWETLAIIEYLAAKYGSDELLPARDTPEGAKAVQWMEFGENQLTVMASEVIVHATDMLPEGRKIPALVERGNAELPKLVGVVENALEGQSYIVGEQFTAADIIIGFALMIAKHAGFVNSDTPQCEQYFARIESRPAYQKAMAL
ncbi:MAG: glutathione S-transferase family protein [Halioglobus sp.]